MLEGRGCEPQHRLSLMLKNQGVSVQNKERQVTSFFFFFFFPLFQFSEGCVTKMFLPEQFLHSYLKEDSGTQQTSPSYL